MSELPKRRFAEQAPRGPIGAHFQFPVAQFCTGRRREIGADTNTLNKEWKAQNWEVSLEQDLEPHALAWSVRV